MEELRIAKANEKSLSVQSFLGRIPHALISQQAENRIMFLHLALQAAVFYHSARTKHARLYC